MRFEPTDLPGVMRVAPEPIADERGFFARLFCPEAFAAAGHPFAPAQVSLSRNAVAGTLRGLHFQAAPFAESKLVRVVRGSVHDVVVDLRPQSPTYRLWTAARLSAENGEALLIPEGCAHGFVTLEDGTDVLYQIDRLYEPGHARGVRYDDPALAIDWPVAPCVIGPADLAWPALEALRSARLDVSGITAALAAERLDLPLTLASIAEVAWPAPSARRAPLAWAADDITVVTAFFDIGRGAWQNGAAPGARFRRTVDDYFAMFARLAKLKNPMIVFTEPRLAERALDLRRANGLEDRTTVVAIPDLFESDLVGPIKAAIERRMSDLFRRWTIKPESPEYRQSRYVLVNALKSAFVCTALDLGLAEAPQVAWIDFGYCRDDQRFDAAEPWRFDAGGKINLFHIAALDDAPISRVVRYGAVYFQGCHIVGPAEAWPALAKEMSFGLAALLACDLVDDDQTLLLMAWRRSPQSYRIHPVHASDRFVVFRRFRTGVPLETFALRAGPRVRIESPLREELRIALKRWEKRFKRLRRLGRR